MNFRTLALSAALLATCAAASAGTKAVPVENKAVSPFYVTVDLGSSTQKSPEANALGLDVSSSSARAVGATLGYTLTPNIDTEISLRDFGTRDETYADELGSLSWKSKAISFAAIAHTDVTKDVQVSAKVGIAHTTMSSAVASDPGKVSGTGVVVGFGAEHKIDRNWSVKANFDVYPNFGGISADLNTLSVGLKYRF